jgi:hypothetical protein
MADNNSAASLIASTPMKVETISLPGFGGGASNDTFNPDQWRVRYSKHDLDDPGAIAELEIIETRGLKGEEIVVLNKSSFSFMDKMFMIVTYLEKITETS